MSRYLYAAMIAALVGAAIVWAAFGGVSNNGARSTARPDLVGKPAMAEPAPTTKYALELPTGRPIVVLEVTAGPLPRGSELVLTLPDGTVLGSISPFGQNRPVEVQRYQMPVERDLLNGGQFTVVPKVATDGVTRPATAKEFIGLRVVQQ